MTGAITEYIDVAQVTLYAFWIFFAGLVIYLHRENKREGYPLESERSKYVRVEGFPATPEFKYFLHRDGTSYRVPREDLPREIAAEPSALFPGAPIEPTGNPMLDGVGPAAWAQRRDDPETALDGGPRLTPMRTNPEFDVYGNDPDPRGLPVVAADDRVAGKIVDIWVDRSEALLRYLEVEVPAAGGTRRVLLPANFAVMGRERVRVRSIRADQFAEVPGTKHPDRVTLLEEDKIMGYYGGGTLYAFRSREEPLL